ncbi:hypothetical protein MVES_001826 [Malassezia vespertilionis]|uniref:chitin synthase n=1 Tax=Malassezia vespertilionis TaxID=2020962 RepID=A0A2N1JDA6_9BASI|nr:hypothetical protein MVES_001826 [Malassezia vespertilionis]
MARSHTLSRPERGQPLAPMLNPDGEPGDPFATGPNSTSVLHRWWHYISIIATFWAPPSLLAMCGLTTSTVRQAWREKITLCGIALVLMGLIAYITVGLQRTLCPKSQRDIFIKVSEAGGYFGIRGEAHETKEGSPRNGGSRLPAQAWDVLDRNPGADLTKYMGQPASNFPECRDLQGAFAQQSYCVDWQGQLAPCIGQLTRKSIARMNLANADKFIGYEWTDIEKGNNLVAIDGTVVDFTTYLAGTPDSIPNEPVDSAIREAVNRTEVGPDGTRLFVNDPATNAAIDCLKAKYIVGRVSYMSSGCFVAEIVLYISLIVILGIVLIRTLMAVWFFYFGARMLVTLPRTSPKGNTNVNRVNHRLSHHILPADATGRGRTALAPWAKKKVRTAGYITPSAAARGPSGERVPVLPVEATPASIGTNPFVICLVTCYSEGYDGINATLSSLHATEYPAGRKLLFVVADGMVTGSGQSMSTPDICVSLMQPDARFGTPIPMSYRSVSSGAQAHNMALVYAGHYVDSAGGEPTPMVVVAKCGTPQEASSKKPGNRGKRDSQMILISFLQRVTYNDPMCPLEYDLFRKVHALMSVTPDYFELLLMVDADTKVYPPALRMLANAMIHDELIMGACGETRIQNKLQSWVTAIQVFEYFISHHQVKAFEAVFGGVTCLPGCFSIYRIKARKQNADDWIPVLVKPEVTREYSQTDVVTLHQKNLLLLGEDRFLSTLLLRTFPHRKMMFVPQAVCRTEVPHTFKMLLSQRRRWINSTVHNLMELVLVRDLCGTFCFSMQFVVFMDLIGTLVLPAAITLTYTLIGLAARNPPKNFADAIPLIMLISVLFLPGFVIATLHFRPPYLIWLLIYLLFLPVWNFILPVYSFWHFDDFTWGETRKVQGETKGDSHAADDDGYIAALKVPMRKWTDWEHSRIRKLKRDERRRMEMEQQFGNQFYNDSARDPNGYPLPPLLMHPAIEANSDEVSIRTTDTDDDRWGDQVGDYDENQAPPELLSSTRPMSSYMTQDSSIFNENDLEDILQDGWGDDVNPLRAPSKGPFLSIPNDSIVSLDREDIDPLSSTKSPTEMRSILAASYERPDTGPLSPNLGVDSATNTVPMLATVPMAFSALTILTT